MRNTFLDTIRGYTRTASRWFFKTPERALDEAYEAALAIKSLEDAHFSGGRISADFGNYGKSAQNYFQSELKKNLDIIKIRLTEFKASRAIFRVSNRTITEIQLEENSSDLQTINVIDKPALILKKLRFIDEILNRYSLQAPNPASVIVVSDSNSSQPANKALAKKIDRQNRPVNGRLQSIDDAFIGEDPAAKDSIKSITDKTGVLPRSILETVDRIKRELDPEAEQELVKDFRKSKARTIISLRLILFLIIIPLLTQQVSKSFVVGPIIDQIRGENPQIQVFLNEEMEEEALAELQRFEQHLRFEILIGQAQPRSEEEIVDLVREKAQELEAEFREISADALKNVFSDLLALLAFVAVLVTSKREIEVLKSFMDQMIYGLSDSAKAFVIILFTDMFVGFHSPHGWEVLLESVSRHFGLPASRDFIFLFIATFPVILDTIFKYWIFRYLNRVSPSAVATYKTMNE
ncbi:MAG: proton extrusion protein PcxA [Elainellaceae cyanobacterium]